MIGMLVLSVAGLALIEVARRNRLRRRLTLPPIGLARSAGVAVAYEREVLLGMGIGVLLRGVAGAWFGVAIGWAFGWLRNRRSRSTYLRRVDDQVPELVRSLIATLRIGGDVHGALGAAADELSEPIGPHLRVAVRRVATGVSLDECLSALLAELPTQAMERVVEALRTGLEVGGDLEAILRFIGEQVRDRLDIDRQRRAATTQGRLSAIVVGGMPVAFLAMTGSSPSSPSRMLLTEPIGWTLLTVGALLEGAGFFWVHRVVRS